MRACKNRILKPTYLLSTVIGSRFWGVGGSITPLWGPSLVTDTMSGFGRAWRYGGLWLQPGVEGEGMAAALKWV